MFESVRRADARRELAWRLAPYLALFVLSLVVYWTYLLEPGRPFYVDTRLPLEYEDFARQYFQAWNANTGNLNFAQIMRLPYVAPLYGAFRTLGVDETWFVTVLFWLPTYLAMAASFAAFRGFLGDRTDGLPVARPTDRPVTRSTDRSVARSTDRPVARSRDLWAARPDDWQVQAVSLLLAVAYALGPWITKHFHHYYFRVSYALVPLALLWFVRYVRHGGRHRLVLAAVSAVLVATNPHFLVYFFLLAGGFAVFDGLVAGTLRRTVRRAALVAGCFLGLSLFWVLPFLFVTVHGESVVGYNVGERIVSLYSARNTPVNLFSLLGGYWPGVTSRSSWLFGPVEHYQLVFFSLPVAALLGLVASDHEDRFALFAGVATVATLALATGYKYGGPVAAVYDFVLALPFHGVLRAPDRLTAVLPLLYGYLIGRAVLDADRRTLRYGAATLLFVAALAAVLVNLHLVGTALSPTVLPADHEHVTEADYEDVFVVPPRPLSGYDPGWMASRETGIVASWDTHLFARPDSRQHALNYYLLELVDRDRTATAVSILRKTGANHVLVRRDVEPQRGVPHAGVTIARLDSELERVYSGRKLVVFDLGGPSRDFRVVRPVAAERDLDAARHLANRSRAYPFFESGDDGSTDSTLEGSRRFHPSTAFRRLNQRDVLSRPPTYAGVEVDGTRALPHSGDGSLVLRAVPLSGGAEVVRETDAGREVYKFETGMDRLRVPLDGRERSVTLRGPVYVEGLSVSEEDPDQERSQVNTSFHGGGTVSPARTDVSFDRSGSAVVASASVRPGGSFWQLSYETARPVDGPLVVDASVTAGAAGDRVGLVLLTTAGEAEFYATGETLRRGRQNLTVHLRETPSAAVSRVQFVVLPDEGPVDNGLTIHDFEVRERPDPSRPRPTRTACRFDSTGRRCAGAAEVASVERQSPTRYRLQVDALAPYALQFGEAYGSLWVAEVDGPDGVSRYRSRPLYLATNGFWIDEAGQHSVTIRYRPQRWFRYGIALSGLGFLVCGVVLAHHRRGSEGGPWRVLDRGRRAVRTVADAVARFLSPRLP